MGIKCCDKVYFITSVVLYLNKSDVHIVLSTFLADHVADFFPRTTIKPHNIMETGNTVQLKMYFFLLHASLEFLS